ncbi:Nucleolar GTP-binding protein 2 [Dionaea muscipula]
MILDSALRTYLEAFRLPGESQKIHRIVEAFSDRFYDQQSSDFFENKDAVLILCYSLIMLNTDQHNPQVKKKMTEDEFIRNNRAINGGKDLPREFLSELFQSIANKAIALDQTGFSVEMNPSRWIELVNRAKLVEPFILCDFSHKLGRDMFASIAGPSVAVLSAIFELADEDDILNECIECLISVARIAQFGLEDILDELIASFCKFTMLLNPYASTEETLYIFANDLKPRMATLAIFTVANKFGESIRGAWRNIVDCLLKLKRLKLLPRSIVDLDTTLADNPSESTPRSARAISENDARFSSRGQGCSMIGRFSHFLTVDNGEDSLVLGGSEFEQNLKVIQQCKIGNIFSNSSNLPMDALLNLGRSLIFAAAGRGQKFSTAIEEEETVTFCWDLIFSLGFANLYRFTAFWPAYHDYMLLVGQFSMFSPVPFAEKAVLVMLKLCLKILSSYQCDKYPEELIFKSMNLMWKYDNEILETCCDVIMQTVGKIINEYPANVQTQLGWKTILHLLTVTGRHPESYDQGVETIINLLSDGTHVSPNNYPYCIDCAFGFVSLKNSLVEKNVKILDLMANSVNLLIRWCKNFSDPAGTSMANKFYHQPFGQAGEALKKTSLARREEVRNQAVFSLKKTFVLAEELELTPANCISCFNVVIFPMVDDLHEKMLQYSRRENAEREMRGMEGTLKNAMEVLTDVFLQYLKPISENPGFRTFWLGVLRRMDTCMKADLGEHGPSRMEQVVPELLKRIIAAMKEKDILVPRETDDLWEITYIQIQWIAPSLKGELFPDVNM